jgi:histidinol dehydrogenase
MRIRILDGIKDKDEIERIRNRKVISDVEPAARDIIEKVRKDGDNALKEFANKFDDSEIIDFEISRQEIKDAYSKLSDKEICEIKNASFNIKKFAEFQLPKSGSIEIKKGIRCGYIISPIEKIGCYIPSGKYPLPSTVMMTVIPAKVAGVKYIYIATPKPTPAIIVAADICDADRIFRVGGAQAIAAFAYGTESIPKVDKIVGPGNSYVTAAKKIVFGDVGIDMLAGPSEILIISEEGDPKFIASDMLAQAEHDEYASAILITTSPGLANEVSSELNKQVCLLDTREVIERSFLRYSAIILVRTIKEALELSNGFAPEHLEIDSKEILKGIRNAGSIFIGRYSCEAAGDYASGTNHVLPTSQTSRFRGGLSVFDFVKIQTYQELSKEGLLQIKETISCLASMENLPAHKNSVLKRFEDVRESMSKGEN